MRPARLQSQPTRPSPQAPSAISRPFTLLVKIETASAEQGHVGPNLQKSSIAEDLAQVEKQVRNGGGALPPFADVLSDEEIDTAARYVVEQIAPKE